MSEEVIQEETPKKGLGMMGLVKAVGFVGILVVVELVAASMFLPSAEETEDLARKLAVASKGEEVSEDPEASESTLDPLEETVEVELVGDNITRFNPDSDKTLNVDFLVFGVVLATESDAFNTAFEKNKSRIREQIVMTMHAAKATDLSSPGLGLIKRQILEKTNRALGKPYINEVIFTKINFVER